VNSACTSGARAAPPPASSSSSSFPAFKPASPPAASLLADSAAGLLNLVFVVIVVSCSVKHDLLHNWHASFIHMHLSASHYRHTDELLPVTRSSLGPRRCCQQIQCRVKNEGWQEQLQLGGNRWRGGGATCSDRVVHSTKVWSTIQPSSVSSPTYWWHPKTLTLSSSDSIHQKRQRSGSRLHYVQDEDIKGGINHMPFVFRNIIVFPQFCVLISLNRPDVWQNSDTDK